MITVSNQDEQLQMAKKGAKGFVVLTRLIYAAGRHEGLSWLTRCGFDSGTQEWKWICGIQADCTGSNFPLYLANPPAIDIAGLAGGSSSSSTCPAIGPATSTSPDVILRSNKSCHIRPLAVGIGVGIPLVVFLTITVASSFAFRRTWMEVRAHMTSPYRSIRLANDHTNVLGLNVAIENKHCSTELVPNQSPVREMGAYED